MIDSAAAAFPRVAAPDRGFGLAWQPVSFSSGCFESTDAVEGAWPRLHIGPGMVRLSSVDHARQLRTRDRAARRAEADRGAARAMARLGVDDGGDYDEALPDRDPVRGVVAGWSEKSRRNLFRTIATLDLSAVVGGVTPPAMVTLTLPGDWLAVAPDARTAAALFHRFTSAYRRRWKAELCCIWKREFQERGAPHWHLWMALPTEDEGEFVRWLSRAWSAVVSPSASPEPGREHVKGVENRYGVPLCVCSERCRHLAAGTGVDVGAGARARDPRRLATYFLKESASLGAKAYQNRPPAAWDGQSVGRYWGVRGLAKAEAIVPLPVEDSARVWRAMRRLLESRLPPEFARVRPVDESTGELRRKRYVRRRIPPRVHAQRAGWVAVNDGPAVAWQLAKLVAGT